MVFQNLQNLKLKKIQKLNLEIEISQKKMKNKINNLNTRDKIIKDLQDKL